MPPIFKKPGTIVPILSMSLTFNNANEPICLHSVIPNEQIIKTGMLHTNSVNNNLIMQSDIVIISLMTFVGICMADRLLLWYSCYPRIGLDRRHGQNAFNCQQVWNSPQTGMSSRRGHSEHCQDTHSEERLHKTNDRGNVMIEFNKVTSIMQWTSVF